MISGKAAAELIAEELEHRILTGNVKTGEYLSSVRGISREFGCAPVTAHRALKQLVEKGLAVAEPRHGYRVSGPKGSGTLRETVAFLEITEGYESHIGDIYDTQLSVLRRASSSRGWASIVLPYQGQSVAQIREQLREMSATALILQDVGYTFPESLRAGLGRLSMPTVSLDLGCVAPGVDLVMRDESHGAGLATDYLVAKGYRRIGWYGPLRTTPNARRRYAGAAEVLLREDISVDALGWAEVQRADEVERAIEYLSRSDRPHAVLALWQTAAKALAAATRELGLRLGSDLEVVGWSLDEGYARGYSAEFPELRERCATVTWSMTDVGETLLNRIAERRRSTELPDARVMLPMRLREPSTLAAP